MGAAGGAAGGRSEIPSSCRPFFKVEKRLRGWFPAIVATGGGAMGGAGGAAGGRSGILSDSSSRHPFVKPRSDCGVLLRSVP